MIASRGEHDCFDLQFATNGRGITFLDAQFARYPIHICRGSNTARACEGACLLTLQSVSGGLFEGDVVNGRIEALAGAHARVTTAASTIVHSMKAGLARQEVGLIGRGGAYLEYLPEPLIMFPDSRLQTVTRVETDLDCTMVICEAFITHDHKGLARPFDRYDSRVEVMRADGRLLARERMLVHGGDWVGKRVGISNRFAAHASVWIIGNLDRDGLQDELRTVGSDWEAYLGASLLPNSAGLQVRVLTEDTVGLRQAISAIATIVRRRVPAARALNTSKNRLLSPA
ncbi:hypothetical protein BH09PSE5_BH09PSE5_41910 [soil metagenome]